MRTSGIRSEIGPIYVSRSKTGKIKNAAQSMNRAVPLSVSRGQHNTIVPTRDHILCLSAPPPPFPTPLRVRVRVPMPAQTTKGVDRACGDHQALRAVTAQLWKSWVMEEKKNILKIAGTFLENVAEVIIRAVMVSKLGLLLRCRDVCWARKGYLLPGGGILVSVENVFPVKA